MTDQTQQTRVLVVDDDAEIRDLLGRYLATHGFEVSLAASAGEAEQMLSGAPELVVLDVMMPGETGTDFLSRLRAQKNSVPVILLTAMAEDTDRIVGLELGADDYVTKPFNPRELVARIKTVLRRADSQNQPAAPSGDGYRFADFEVIPERRTVTRAGEALELTSGEYELLLCFITHPGRVLSRDFLMDHTRGRDADPLDRTIDVALSRLRRKIEADPAHPELIKTVRGGGYVLSAKVDRTS